jgi:hypothetical protein
VVGFASGVEVLVAGDAVVGDGIVVVPLEIVAPITAGFDADGTVESFGITEFEHSHIQSVSAMRTCFTSQSSVVSDPTNRRRAS